MTPSQMWFSVPQLFSLSIEECWLLHSELVRTWSERRGLQNWLWHLNRVVRSRPVTRLVNSPAEAPYKPSVFAIKAPALHRVSLFESWLQLEVSPTSFKDPVLDVVSKPNAVVVNLYLADVMLSGFIKVFCSFVYLPGIWLGNERQLALALSHRKTLHPFISNPLPAHLSAHTLFCSFPWI